MTLGKLEKVELRSFWKHEATDFTEWLSQPENLETLGDEIGLEITLVNTEVDVGSFSADIVAREETSGIKIVIENQLETTDHKHLGQVLTYAAGLGAEYIVWVVKDARDEHKQAVDWLNEHTNEKINFFLLRIELWRIGKSELAPKFEIVCSPNDWTKSIRSNAFSSNELSETKLFQLEFWKQLCNYAKETYPRLKLRTPKPQHWFNIAIGNSNCYISLTTNTSEDKVGCEIYIKDSKELFNIFFSNKDAIEKELELNDISWQPLPSKKASRVRITRPANFDEENQNKTFDWLLQTATKFSKTFGKEWSNK